MTITHRSSAAVNADIRALWASQVLGPGDRTAYQRLLVEWAAAIQREAVVAEAAMLAEIAMVAEIAEVAEVAEVA